MTVNIQAPLGERERTRARYGPRTRRTRRSSSRTVRVQMLCTEEERDALLVTAGPRGMSGYLRDLAGLPVTPTEAPQP